jgi:ATP adenylyltransferase/5',5'''-P-1,P-4-tetraphosphate phosphorylase II
VICSKSLKDFVANPVSLFPEFKVVPVRLTVLFRESQKQQQQQQMSDIQRLYQVTSAE